MSGVSLIISSLLESRKSRSILTFEKLMDTASSYTPFHPADGGNTSTPDIRCLVYIGLPDNPQFLGALSQEDVAEKINQSIGPSGENREYLLQLEEALLQLSPSSQDEHISDLARRVPSHVGHRSDHLSSVACLKLACKRSAALRNRRRSRRSSDARPEGHCEPTSLQDAVLCCCSATALTTASFYSLKHFATSIREIY